MKLDKIATLALLLWIATLAAFAWFFVRGDTTAGTDNRTAIRLAPGERGFILGEMRGLLGGVHDVLEGIDRGDRQRVAQAARAMGLGSAADVAPALLTKLPLAFKQLGMSMHRDMDDLALAAEKGQSAAELQAMLTRTLAKCVACHAAWQLAPSS